jgi:hypothetical protein
MPESTTMQDEIRFTARDNVRWSVGCRTHSLGEYLVKLGDRIHGDAPMGLDESYDAGYARGRRQGQRDVLTPAVVDILDIYEQLDEGRKQRFYEYVMQLLAEQQEERAAFAAGVAAGRAAKV